MGAQDEDHSTEMNSQETNSSREDHVRNSLKHEAPVLVAMVALILLKLWLVAWQEVAAQGSARFDDYLFVELGQHLKHGDWLGPYNERTLVKGPVYPIWLAAVSLARIPLLPAQHLLHAAAAVALVLVIGRLLPHRGVRIALFAVLLFDPGTYETTSHRVTREGIYTSLTLLVLVCAAALAVRPHLRNVAAWTWATFLSAMLSLFWFTREEGPWLLPAVAIPLLFAAFHRVRATHGWRRLSALAPLAAPLVILAAAHLTLAQINRHYYTAAATIELRAPWFTHAYGALTRVDPEHAIVRIPVTAAARAQIYKASPAFAELEPHLEGRSRLVNSLDTDDAESPAPPEEMTGTWFIWAFRDAVAAAGYHDTLPHAREYYVRLAREVNAACAEGRLVCGPPHSSLAPAWRPEYVERCWRFSRRIVHGILSMRSVRVDPLPSEGSGPEALARYKEITQMRIEGDGQAPDDATRFFRIAVLQMIAAIYRICFYPAVILAVVAFTAGFVRDLRARTLSPRMVLAAAVLAAVLTRVALLTYISASAYPIFHGIYLRVLYPMLYVFIALCAAHIVAMSRTPRTAPAQSEDLSDQPAHAPR